MILTYLLFHQEKMYTFLFKIKSFFMFIFSMEFCVSIGVHLSLKNKYSYNNDNIISIMKIVNASNVMFVSIPQILIVCICSSSENEFTPIGIYSLVISIIFLIWSFIYYFICIVKEDDIEDYGNEVIDSHYNNNY